MDNRRTYWSLWDFLSAEARRQLRAAFHLPDDYEATTAAPPPDLESSEEIERIMKRPREPKGKDV
ncbi:MAG TPA: hypothetical protein VNL15_06020 [Dehalococcoidia bacterium]|nr:hypothetical protein [Dehalococcoidia bacterium]